MAFAAVGALFTAGAAGAAITGTMVLAAVTEIGIAMTVVGAVTGSKSLMKLGGVMSLVGGVGGMVAGAAGGAAAGAAGVAEGAGAGSAAAAESAITGEAAFGGYAAEAGSAAAGEAGLTAGGLGGSAMNSSMPDPTGSLDATSSATSADAARTMRLTPDAASGSLPGPATVQAPVVADGTTVQGATEAYNPYTNPTDARLAAGTQTTPGGAPQSSSSFWDTFSQFADKNKEWIKGGLSGMQKSAEQQQKNSNDNRYMDIQQQKVNQTGYANSTANFAPRGIIAGAR